MHRRVLLLSFLGACSSAERPAVDAGWDSFPRDARLPPDSTPPIPTVDFAVANCPNPDVQKGTCRGTAPLTIQFIPVASSGITQFSWDFGDNVLIDGLAPSHTFDEPGTFDITLYGGGVKRTRVGFIDVSPGLAGSPCMNNRQCASNLCLCSREKPCGYGQVNGFCSSLCQNPSSCPDGQVCVNLVTAASNMRPEPWQTQVCLPACVDDQKCTAGLTCRSLPAWPNTATRVKGCFASVPAEMGRPCVNENNDLRNDLCLSGLCADLGAWGLCSRDCSSDGCPVGSECAWFGDGRALCLLPCSPTFKCDADPLLSCEVAGLPQSGFRIQSSSNIGARYCAPKPCAASSDCGASGTCVQASDGGHCVSRYR